MLGCKKDDGLYIPAKTRRNQKNSQVQIECRVNENRAGPDPNPETLPGYGVVELPLSNIERFFQNVTPCVTAQFFHKTRMRGWKTCDVEYKPYFKLSDLWESFREWSAYGAGVPLVLDANDSDSVVQYYVPYLSAIQIYVPSKSRRTSEDNDDFSVDSTSAGSNDSEWGRGLANSRGQQNHISHPGDSCLRDKGASPQGCLLFEYFEHGQPHGRVPLADKIADLALGFPELKSLRSCDVLCSSWFSVAWYPIYGIPMGPASKDLEACFLTYHSLYTPVGDPHPAQAPVIIYPSEIDGTPMISLPVVGFASYKFKGSLWTSNGGNGHQLVNSLVQSADRWLRELKVKHPDYLFFCRNR